MSVTLGQTSERIGETRRQSEHVKDQMEQKDGCHQSAIQSFQGSTERYKHELKKLSEAMAGSYAEAQGGEQRTQEMEESQQSLLMRISSLWLTHRRTKNMRKRSTRQ